MKVLINYANDAFKPQQHYNTKTAYRKGGFDKVIEYSPDDIDEEFRCKYSDILSISRGNGLWLWKPYFIKKTLSEINYGDYLFYCDSGSFFVNSIDLLISKMEMEKIDVMPFYIPLIDLQFSSKQCIDLMKCNEDKYLFTPQREGTFILLKKSEHSIQIIDKFLESCKDYRLLQGGELGEDCIAHREDQSIWSLLTKKENIKAFRDPTQYSFAGYYKDYFLYCNRKSRIAIASFDIDSNIKEPCVLIEYRSARLYKFLPRVKFFLKFYLYSFFENI